MRRHWRPGHRFPSWRRRGPQVPLALQAAGYLAHGEAPRGLHCSPVLPHLALRREGEGLWPGRASSTTGAQEGRRIPGIPAGAAKSPSVAMATFPVWGRAAGSSPGRLPGVRTCSRGKTPPPAHSPPGGSVLAGRLLQARLAHRAQGTGLPAMPEGATEGAAPQLQGCYFPRASTAPGPPPVPLSSGPGTGKGQQQGPRAPGSDRGA